MLATTAALGAAISWGLADFFGGIRSRRLPVPLVLLGSTLAGTLVTGAIVLARSSSAPPRDEILLAVAAGAVAMVALGSFYSALAIGKMSIVTPITATGVVIPVAVGIAGGDKLSALVVIGICLALPGVILAAREQEESETSQSQPPAATALAFVAAIGFGALFVLIEAASRTDEFWSVFVQRSSAFAMFAVLVIALRLSRGPAFAVKPRTVTPGMPVGLLDTTAMTAFAYASTHGPLSVASVLAATYPVVPVLLAHRFLGERISTPQKVGVAMTMLGVVALAAG